ncbi:MAG: LptF/LptG family permease [Treponema sp.]|nr:LptF/LptG family permease [Treponema sp.]
MHTRRLSERIDDSLALLRERIGQALTSFNLLNWVFRSTGRLLYRLGLRRLGNIIAMTVQEESGINRFVMVRYLTKELFLYFFIAFLFFFMVFFCNQILLLAENILKKRVPLMDVLRLISYSLPMIIAQSAPFATLVGFLMCLGRLVTENEVLILRASGMGYKILVLPVIILGLVISIISFFVNDYLLPLGTIKYNQLRRTILMSNPAIELESNSVKRTNDKTLVIGQVNGTNVSDLVFFDTDTNGDQRIIVADASDVKKSTTAGVLMSIEMNDSTVVFFDSSSKSNYDVLQAKNLMLNIFESSFFNGNNRVIPSEMTSYDLKQRIKEMEKDTGVNPKDLNKYRLEYNKKFSVPFGSIFFALLALPLALIFGKHNGQTIGLIIGLFISVAYWAMMILGQIFGSRSGMNGVLLMWIPNSVIFTAALFFYTVLGRK